MAVYDIHGNSMTANKTALEKVCIEATHRYYNSQKKFRFITT